jgi:hypothetical protein
VGQERSRNDVADGEDARYRGFIVLVHRDSAVAVVHNTGLLQSEAGQDRFPADRNENFVALHLLGLVAGLQLKHGLAVLFLHPGYPGAHAEHNALLLQDLHQGIRHLSIGKRKHLGQHLHNRHLRA